MIAPTTRRRSETKAPGPAAIRCAVYTRKSTEEGLEQDFNSLDAQREAAEAYIVSQKSKGWACLPDRYDDGGYTGGNTDRPAFQRLMADVQAGKIDCIVVYKVDRLSRLLLDFAKIIETLDTHGVSFVSVTQQFDTTTSMGRLTLNILLSFAQFEREIIAERTRDKIAAAKRRGKWMGGILILGYDRGENGGLVVNPDEAPRVKEIFRLYLRKKSLLAVAKELRRRGWRNKEWVTKRGRRRGGKHFDKNSLFYLLTNVAYVGKIKHHDQLYDGEHPAIVPEELFEKVQAQLRRNGRSGGRGVRNKYGALLRGLLRCGPCDCAMVHSYTVKGAKRYRYYVCSKAQKQGWESCPTKSVPAGEIEKFVVDQIRSVGRDPELVAETLKQVRKQNAEAVGRLEAEQAILQRELKGYAEDVRRLVGQPNASAALASLQDRIHVAERRATEVAQELAALQARMVDEQELADAMAAFDPVWDALKPNERARVLELLVETVVYDGAEGKVTVTFRPTGIKALAQETSELQEVQA
jgi:site-specific DNA recombinase